MLGVAVFSSKRSTHRRLFKSAHFSDAGLQFLCRSEAYIKEPFDADVAHDEIALLPREDLLSGRKADTA